MFNSKAPKIDNSRRKRSSTSSRQSISRNSLGTSFSGQIERIDSTDAQLKEISSTKKIEPIKKADGIDIKERNSKSYPEIARSANKKLELDHLRDQMETVEINHKIGEEKVLMHREMAFLFRQHLIIASNLRNAHVNNANKVTRFNQNERIIE